MPPKDIHYFLAISYFQQGLKNIVEPVFPLSAEKSRRDSAYGFGERSLNLMRSFFDERLNRVKMCDATSDWTKMERGCPQGSSFGPLLWNIYQNDMSAHVKDVNLTMYADDHQMYVKGWEHETVRRRMKTQGQQALPWYSNNFLLANPDKFQSLNINPRKLDKDKSDKTLSINDLDIANTELIKLLGVHIDENLNFTEHISKLCTKASKKVGVLSRLRNLIPCKAKLLLYKSFILPYLTYCHLIWHFCKSSDKRKLERIQERALRVIYKSHSATYEELLRRADIPSLYNRRLQDITALMYKVKHGLVPYCVSELFVRKVSTHSLRNSDFVLPRFETICYGKHSVRYLGPFLWSKLTDNQRDSPSLHVFINKIRKLNLADLLTNNSNCCNLCSQ